MKSKIAFLAWARRVIRRAQLRWRLRGFAERHPEQEKRFQSLISQARQQELHLVKAPRQEDAKPPAESPVLGCASCRALPTSPDSPCLEQGRYLFDSSHEGFSLTRCRHCGQIYLKQFHEVQFGDDDDIWERWMPLTQEEQVEIDRLFPEQAENRENIVWLLGLMRRRRRLTRDPQGRLFWRDEPWDAGDLIPPS